MISHVLFDRQPRVMGHLCEEHRQVPVGFECRTDHGDGECDHVQFEDCDCASEPPCVVCAQMPLWLA